MPPQKRSGHTAVCDDVIEVFLTVITDQLEVFLFVWFHYERGEGYVLEALWLADVRDHSDGGLAQLLP